MITALTLLAFAALMGIAWAIKSAMKLLARGLAPVVAGVPQRQLAR